MKNLFKWILISISILAIGTWIYAQTAVIGVPWNLEGTWARTGASVTSGAEIRSGATAQTFRLHTSYTDTANYERLGINTAAGLITFSAETLGTGTDNIDLVLAPAGTGGVGNFYNIDPIPIGWVIDGTTAPGATSTLTSTNKAKYRDFSGAADNDVYVEWQVPYGIDAATGITFQVEGWITNATAPANMETVKFVLSGVSIGDSELLSSAQGAAITVEKTFDATYVQYDRFVTGYSAAVTIAGLTAGEIVIFLLTRDTTDTYAQAIGVGWLKIKYMKKLQVS